MWTTILYLILSTFVITAQNSTPSNQKPSYKIIKKLSSLQNSYDTRSNSLRFVPPTPKSRTTTCECGSGVSKRIINGTIVSDHTFPFMVSIRRKVDGAHFCGGSIISNLFVLTAAHCLLVTTAENVQVRVGDLNIDVSGESDHEKTFDVVEFITHDTYGKKQPRNNDIGLLKLNQTIYYNEGVQPVCLDFLTEWMYLNKTLTAIGWGTTNVTHPRPNDQLLKIDLKLVKRSRCKNETDYSSQPELLTNRMICAVSEFGDACQGDSGGPLVIYENGKWVQVGIVSWGVGCANPNYPGIYTKISPLLPWIYGKTSNSTYCT